MSDILYIVVPCYNEQEVLPETSARLRAKLAALVERRKVGEESRILFVNDGSKDRTWEIIRGLCEGDPAFGGVNLSRNRGHQNALLAGIEVAAGRADMIISMDADLQDDVDAVDKMVDRYAEGYDVVYGVRSSRKRDTFFKRNSAQLFYKLLRALGAEVVYNHADYRLLSKRAATALLSFDEVNLFLRGIVPMVGFRSTTVTYERGERFAGKSKYPLGKMVAFAFEGLTSLSVKPIRLIMALGILVCIVSLCMFAKALIDYARGNVVPGWTSVIISIWLLGGLELFSIGVIGEYIGKTYMETKRRPRYVIESVILSGGGNAPGSQRDVGASAPGLREDGDCPSQGFREGGADASGRRDGGASVPGLREDGGAKVE